MASERGLILRKTAFAESDWLVDVLLKNGSRLTLKAKNAALSKRRFAGGVLDPFNYVEIQFRQARAGTGHLYLEEAKCLESFSGLRTNYQRLQAGLFMLKVTGKIAREGMPNNSEMFDLLGNSLRALETTQAASLLLLHFKLKCLHLCGLLPINEDTQEFVATPIREHGKIRLSEDEYLHLSRSADTWIRDLADNLDE